MGTKSKVLQGAEPSNLEDDKITIYLGEENFYEDEIEPEIHFIEQQNFIPIIDKIEG